MKVARLIRASSTKQGTPGAFLFGDHALQAMELPWKENQRQISCIPPGTYQLAWKASPKFGVCYHVLDVPDRSNVLIHSANFAGSVEDGFFTQLHGCIAPCTRLGFMKNPQGRMQLAGLVSRPALSLFEEWGAGAFLELSISGVEE